MTKPSGIFEETYRGYLEQLDTVDLSSVAEKLGGEWDGDTIRIPVFATPYTVSGSGIADTSGKRPSLDVCVVLCKYLLLCPPYPPRGKDWVAYRDMKDTGPLTVFWAHDVERAVLKHFAGRAEELAEAGRRMGGYLPEEMTLNDDVAMQFDGLPKVPLLLLFNEADEEFPARCSVLFERRAERYLDPESLAMLGSLLALSLKRAPRRP